MKTFIKTVLTITAVCLAMPFASAQAPSGASEEQQVKAYMDMMRKDVRKETQAIVDQAMGLEAGDKAKFWTVYEKYQADVKALWDQRLVNIQKYAENYDKMTDAVADQLATTAMNNDQQRLAILKKYYPQMKAALGSKVAARWLQVESALSHVIGLQLASEIPLMK
jgi:hypothetical protein